MLTQARLKHLLHYDPESGMWTWLVDRPGRGAKVGDRPTHKEGSGYIQFSVDGRNYHSKRLAWLYMTGDWPPEEVDHIDLDRANDRWSNFRLASHSQNMANRAVFSNNHLGVKGVRRDANMKSKPFRARIYVDGRSKHLGYFETAELANAAYLAAADKQHGEFARAA